MPYRFFEGADSFSGKRLNRRDGTKQFALVTPMLDTSLPQPIIVFAGAIT
jgi:hypothetical protein